MKNQAMRTCRGPAEKNHHQYRQAEPTANLATEIATRKTALTALEVAVILACSYPHVCKMAKRGSIPSMRIGGMLRFDPIELSNWMQSKSMS